MECEVAGRRRKLVSDADQRRLQEALRKKEEAALRRRDREHNLALTSSEMMTTGLTDHHPPPSPVPEESGGDGGDGLDSRHTTCPKCGESMRQSQLSTHQEKQCSRRRVMCPNYHNGCKQRLVPLFLLQTHLRSECAAEKHKDRMIAKAAQRRGTLSSFSAPSLIFLCIRNIDACTCFVHRIDEMPCMWDDGAAHLSPQA